MITDDDVPSSAKAGDRQRLPDGAAVAVSPVAVSPVAVSPVAVSTVAVSTVAMPAAGDELLSAWVAAGLIDADQAEAIARWQAERRGGASVGAPRPSTPNRRPVVVEALAYVGGAVIAAALTMVFFSYWEALDPVVQIVIPAAATVVLLAGGALVPQRVGPIAVRLRGVLWAVSVATFVAVVSYSMSLANIAEPAAPRWGAAAVVCYAIVLWLFNRAGPQQLATFVATEFFVVAFANWNGDIDGTRTGAILAGVAVLWGVAAWRGLLPGLGSALQRRWGTSLAAVGAAVGGIVLAAAGEGAWLGVIPVVLIIVAAVALSDVVIVGIGAVAALIVLPTIADYYLRSTIGVALVLLVTGAALVVLAVAMVRRRSTPVPDGDYSRQT